MDYTNNLFVFSEINKLVRLYFLCSSLLVLKIMLLIVFTICTRMKTKAFISQEDADFFGGEVVINDRVERIRRAVQNDLENTLPFIIISYFYIYTNPPAWLVYILFLVFLVVRYLHGIVYAVIVVHQPTRAILWAIGFIITGFMALSIALFGLKGLMQST
ncbi:hypothetical protein WA026_004919 [Henosepilachna vigintioctopunctata]|uniref:Microsomal glutathione S-transferase 1 n=1 Tax=Henosepilachna vigintioctopunctata TaxID=420089 RepID=A0AAW1UTY8_9CUCU